MIEISREELYWIVCAFRPKPCGYHPGCVTMGERIHLHFMAEQAWIELCPLH